MDENRLCFRDIRDDAGNCGFAFKEYIFRQYGTVEQGHHAITVAILEDFDGNVEMCHPLNIRFGKPKDKCLMRTDDNRWRCWAETEDACECGRLRQERWDREAEENRRKRQDSRGRFERFLDWCGNA